MKVVSRILPPTLAALVAFGTVGACRSGRTIEERFLFERSPQYIAFPYSAEDVWAAVVEEVSAAEDRHILAQSEPSRMISWIEVDSTHSSAPLYVDETKLKTNKIYSRGITVVLVDAGANGSAKMFVRHVHRVFHKKKPIAGMAGSRGHYERSFAVSVRRRLDIGNGYRGGQE